MTRYANQISGRAKYNYEAWVGHHVRMTIHSSACYFILRHSFWRSMNRCTLHRIFWGGYFEGKSIVGGCQNLSLNPPTLPGYSLWAEENNGPKKKNKIGQKSQLSKPISEPSHAPIIFQGYSLWAKKEEQNGPKKRTKKKRVENNYIRKRLTSIQENPKQVEFSERKKFKRTLTERISLCFGFSFWPFPLREGLDISYYY